LIASGVQAAFGVDIGMPGLHSAKKNYPNAVFIAACLTQLPFRDNLFDFIYSIDVVEHLEQPLLALQEYHRICRPGGYILVQTPNYPLKRIYDLWHWIRRARTCLADDPTHVSCFSAFTWKEIIRKAGLQIVSMYARNIAFQQFVPTVRTLRSTWFGHRFCQKIIIVALKP
jgi:ubiquinone/menaquinone biosynthesis C-methylase UbiE